MSQHVENFTSFYQIARLGVLTYYNFSFTSENTYFLLEDIGDTVLLDQESFKYSIPLFYSQPFELFDDAVG